MGQRGWNEKQLPYDLPQEDGTNGQLLQTDGNGNVEWASVAGATPTVKVNTETVSNPDLTDRDIEFKVSGSKITAQLSTELQGKVDNGETAHGWGNHANENYLKSFQETDPVFSSWNKSTGISITESQISDLKAYLLNETDPTVPSHVKGITSENISAWNNKFDATITDPETGQVIGFDGTNWVNQDASGGSTEPIYFFEGTTAAELQTLIDTVSAAGGGVIQLKAMTYSFTTMLTIPTEIVINGAGRRSTVLDVSAITTSEAFQLDGASYSGFKNLEILGATTGAYYTFKVINYTAHFLFENIYARQSGRGFFFGSISEAKRAEYLSLKRCDIQGYSYPIITGSENYYVCNFTLIEDCILRVDSTLGVFSCTYAIGLRIHRSNLKNVTLTTAPLVKCGGGGSYGAINTHFSDSEFYQNTGTGYVFWFSNNGKVQITNCNIIGRGGIIYASSPSLHEIYISNCYIEQYADTGATGSTGLIRTANNQVNAVVTNCRISNGYELLYTTTNQTGFLIFSNCWVQAGRALYAPNQTTKNVIKLIGCTITGTIDCPTVDILQNVDDGFQVNKNFTIDGNLNVGSGDLVVDATTGVVSMASTPTYADNAAALAGGLVAGDIYKTATGELRIVI